MKKLIASAAVALGASFMAAPAVAGTIVVDFAGYAAGNEHGVTSGTSVEINGVSMTFSAGDFYDDGIYNPYFDDVSGGLPAGLGVCRVLTAADQCRDAGDDSTDGDGGISEYIAIVFDDGPFSVWELGFRDGQHNDITTNDVGVVEWAILDGLGGVVTSGFATFADVVAMAAAGDFANIAGIGFAYVDTEFYIEYISDVPIPAALPLLLSGLAGLGFASRRKKKVA